MKKCDFKSVILGFFIGTIGVTTAFAANGIESATFSNAKVTLDGITVPLNNSLVAIKKDNEKETSLYIPGKELLEYLGYTVNWDGTKDTVNIVSNGNTYDETAEGVAHEGNVVINLSNKSGQRNIAESGSFEAENNQLLTLDITSGIKGGSVDLFLFDPSGKEQRITIGSADTTAEITLTKGVWQYNCSGIFEDGGTIKIIGSINK